MTDNQQMISSLAIIFFCNNRSVGSIYPDLPDAVWDILCAFNFRTKYF